ncbi:MAG TPA: hypothetical protein VIN17_04010 [Paracoccaceae bacterium]
MTEGKASDRSQALFTLLHRQFVLCTFRLGIKAQSQKVIQLAEMTYLHLLFRKEKISSGTNKGCFMELANRALQLY